MAIFSSTLLLRTHALTLLTTCYFLLTSPATLLGSAAVWILGEAMHVRPSQFQPSVNPLTNAPLPIEEETSEVLAVVALVLAISAVTQLIFAGGLTPPAALQSGRSSTNTGNKARLGEEVHTTIASQSCHLSLAVVHVFSSGLLVAWIYLFHSSRNMLLGAATSARALPGSLGALLGNQVVFSAALMDMLFWGYLWTVIREERREVLTAVQGMRSDEDD